MTNAIDMPLPTRIEPTFVEAGYSNVISLAQTKLYSSTHIYLPQIPNRCILILDSWAPFSNHVAIQATMPTRKSCVFGLIPSGATGHIQPADVASSAA